ncbi:lanthionine synthetase LanC family protein [Actinophytocola oryzae]|uniref:Lanthionine synthetase-like protein n=1 Tax=Actinophytocola oryzae TaxID=502181 RepID=A0A4V3FTM5_9PSEU|nr:lanthionine synthetase LanC family protein [Actinophytocola oryzae]TDV51901.1 lanthionine synthetase-like protein [Actinophytocola oryzae]
MTVSAEPTAALSAAAERVLASWTASAAADTAGPDLGPVVLATLVPDGQVPRDAIRAWLRTGNRRRAGLGLFGGMSGILAGLRLVATRYPNVVDAAERTAVAVATAEPRWRTSELGFDDYDVVLGSAGVVLAQVTGVLPVRQEWLAPAVTHLVGLAESTTGFRIGAFAGHPLVGWAQGGVVTGLAHGVAGPVAALSMAMPHLPGDARVADAVHRLASWLVSQRCADERGVMSWPARGTSAGCVGEVRRQAWCYGTPGVAWALWAAGQMLVHGGHDGGALCAVATEAMETLCAAYDPDFHLTDEPLAACHGAAGMLLVADAFTRHAGLPAAAALRDTLTGHLVQRLDELPELDATLLSGATGVLAALLTAAGGDRGWLPCLAMY